MDALSSGENTAPKTLGSDEAFQKMLAALSAFLESRVVQPRSSLNKLRDRRDAALARHAIKIGIVVACIALGGTIAYDVYRAKTPEETSPGFVMRQMNSAVSLLHWHEELPFTGGGNVSVGARLDEELRGRRHPREQQANPAPTGAIGDDPPPIPAESPRGESPLPRSAIDDKMTTALDVEPKLPNQAILTNDVSVPMGEPHSAGEPIAPPQSAPVRMKEDVTETGFGSVEHQGSEDKESGSIPWTTAEVLEAQTRLQRLRLDPGPIDGIPGPLTMASIARFNGPTGSQSTAKLDSMLLEKIRRADDARLSFGDHRRSVENDQ